MRQPCKIKYVVNGNTFIADVKIPFPSLDIWVHNLSCRLARTKICDYQDSKKARNFLDATLTIATSGIIAFTYIDAEIDTILDLSSLGSFSHNYADVELYNVQYGENININDYMINSGILIRIP